MTENEAIERIIGSACSSGKCYDACLYGEGNCEYDAAIIALKEVQRYREIGTVEECREAAEKEKPKPCEFYGDEEDGKLLCPNCGEDLWDLKECGFNNCPYCGQAVTL